MHEPYWHRYNHRWHHLPWPYHHYPWWSPEDDIPPIPEPPYGYPERRPYRVPIWTKEDELKMLEEEELALEEELEMLRKRKEELKKEVK